MFILILIEDIKFPDWVVCRVSVKAAFWVKTTDIRDHEDLEWGWAYSSNLKPRRY